MKKKPDAANRLCLSCKLPCKQPAFTVIARCPKYRAAPKVKQTNWKQMEFRFK